MSESVKSATRIVLGFSSSVILIYLLLVGFYLNPQCSSCPLGRQSGTLDSFAKQMSLAMQKFVIESLRFLLMFQGPVDPEFLG